MEYTLRPSRPDDFEYLFALHKATIREAVEATWGPWDEAWQRNRYRKSFRPEVTSIILVGGEPAGMVRVYEEDGDVFLALLEVAPAFQGRGLGTAIIQDILDSAHARGQAVTLHVLRANPQARRLYERLGFAVTEEREERFVMRAPPPQL